MANRVGGTETVPLSGGGTASATPGPRVGEGEGDGGRRGGRPDEARGGGSPGSIPEGTRSKGPTIPIHPTKRAWMVAHVP